MSSSRTDSSSQGRNLVLAIQQRCNESVILELVDPTNVNITDGSGKTALFYAIQSNYRNVVGALIKEGADVNISEKDGKTALFYAIHSRDYENAIPALIAAGANVNKTEGYNDQTPLIDAVIQRNNESVVQALIDAGADVNITDKSGKTALFHAVEKRNSKSVVQILIEAGVDVNIIDNDGKTALFYAVEQANKKRVVQALIDAGADLNITDKYGKTALFYALEQRNSESLVQVLIEAGADVNMIDKHGKTALLYAVRLNYDCESLVLSLIDAGADVNFSSTNNLSVLSSAVQKRDNESLVRSLINAGAKVNQTVFNSATALYLAVSQSNNESMVHALIDAGADVNITKDNGQTALFNAVRQGNEDMIHTLIDSGAEVNLVDKEGETPFSLALTTGYSGDVSTILTLIARGANVNISINGTTALLWAIQQRRMDVRVVRAMIEAGAKADVNKTDSNNKTPLYYAVRDSNNKGVISALIDAGADVNLTYDVGETVLFYAIRHNNTDVVHKLIAAGADVNLTYDDGSILLFYAAEYCYNESMVQTLVDAGADIKIADNSGQTILIHVVRGRHKSNTGEKARALIDLGAEVNKSDKSGKTSLLYAAQSNNENLVRALIDAGADVHVTDSEGKTALFYAIQQNDNDKAVRALIDAKADVNKTDKYGYTALFYAVQQKQNEKVVKALIAADADINIILNDGQTALFYAAQQENNEIVVKALIEAGVDASITDKYGKTALFYAVLIAWDNTEGVVRALIEANKDILTVKDIYGRTALFYINLRSPKTTIYLLQEEGIGCLQLKDNCHVNFLTVSIENCISQTGCYDTIKDGVLQKLTKQGIIKRESFTKAIINIMFRKYICEVLRNPHYNFWRFEELSRIYRETLDNNVLKKTNKMENLMAELKKDFHNTSKALELLVELGADPDSADSDGNTALHLTARAPLLGASEETVIELCKHLKKFEVRFNARNHQHQTPLLFCISQITENKLQSAMKTVVKVCRFLVKNGSSIEESSRKGEAVFHFILKLFQESLKLHDTTERQKVLNDLIELLHLFYSEEAAKLAVNKSDVDLNSPLHVWASLALPSPQDYATDHTFQSLLKVILNSLLKCGARVNARNHNDETPLHFCKTWFAVKLLIEAGANVNEVDSSRRPALLVAAKNQLFLENPNCFYPDVCEEPRSFWKNALEIGLVPFTADKQEESVLGILVASENFILAKSLVDVACKENDIQSKKETISLLNAICRDKSTKTHWKAGLVQDILKPTRKISAATALRFCCENEMEASVPNVQAQDKAVPMDVIDGEGDDGDKEPRPKRRRVDQDELDEKGEALDPDTSISVHLEIINILRWFGAADDEACNEAAEKYPALKRFLMSKVNTDEIPKFIPWNSVSKRYEGKLAMVSRRQEYQEIDQYWYHKDHVGSGSFGHIFVGINGKDGREVAIKRMEALRMQRPRNDKREMENLTALAYCEQVVRYLNFFEDKMFSYIVLELMEGNLEEYLTDLSIFDAKKGVELCHDVVKGLRYLNENDILHRDLKPQNILYKTHPRLCLKIADFGLSRRMDSTSTTVYGTNAGTRCWIAPEVLKGSKDLSKASDMFSCGLLLHYIFAVKKHPFLPADCVNKSEAQVANETETNIILNTMEGWDNSLSPEATHLIKWMLKHDEKKRATAGEASDHPFCYSRKKKIDFLIAVANQQEFACSWKSHSLTTDFEKIAGTIFNGNWNDPKYLHMPAIHAEMTKTKTFRSYRTLSAVDLVRFIRNSYEHVSHVTRPTMIRKMLLEDFVFLEYFPNLVMEVYKAVTIHGWDQSRDEIKYVMKN